MANYDLKQQLQAIRDELAVSKSTQKAASQPQPPALPQPIENPKLIDQSTASATNQTTAKPSPPADDSSINKTITPEAESFADLLHQESTHNPVKQLADNNQHPHFDPHTTAPPSSHYAPTPPEIPDVPDWVALIDEQPQDRLTWGESISYIKAGHPQGYIKKLRRGQFSIGFTIDLHGYYLKEATQTVHKLLNVAKANHHAAVRIIHGKGRHSSNKGPVIKNMLNHQLRLRDDVIAFCTAPQHDGGTGVLYCLLML